jgi:hypothetical protein
MKKRMYYNMRIKTI